MFTPEPTRVGWIGLGKMGTPMAARLCQAGYRVAVFNRSPGRTQPLLDIGATAASSPHELGEESSIVVSMVSDDRALLDITQGEASPLLAMRPGSIFIDMSTVSPQASATVATLAKRQAVRYLRAPVSGSVASAGDGALTILVSGPMDAVSDAEALFHTLGGRHYYVGAEEQARYLKIAINMMIGGTATLLAEALCIAESGGLDWEDLIEVVSNSAAGSPLIKYKAQMLRERRFDPMFTASQMSKDLDLALDAGRNHAIPLPLTALSCQQFVAMQAGGMGDLDFFAYIAFLERMAGLNSAATSPIHKPIQESSK